MRVPLLQSIVPTFDAVQSRAAASFCRSVCSATLLFTAGTGIGGAGSSAAAATLLFSTGFEPGTVLPAIPGNQAGPNGYAQFFSGTDNSTGFNWANFPFQDASAIELHDEPGQLPPAKAGGL